MKMKLVIEVEVDVHPDIRDTPDTFKARWVNNKVSTRVAEAIEQGALCLVTALSTKEVV